MIRILLSNSDFYLNSMHYDDCNTPRRWNFITAHPNTLGHTISNYINSTKTIKKLQLHAKVEWDWNNLKNALVNLIRRFVLILKSSVGKCSWPRNSNLDCCKNIVADRFVFSTKYQGDLLVHFCDLRNTLSVM
jgi:hypothetical protein